LSNSLEDRVMALAGLMQALSQVRRVAETGEHDGPVVRTLMDSIFRIDAPSPQAVYGRVGELAPGLQLVRDYGLGRLADPALPKLAMAVLQLERRFVNETQTTSAVRAGLQDLAPQAQADGSIHPDVLAAVGTLYADTVSHLRPRVMVSGNPHYLAQPGVVSEVRAILMTALRSAVLWRQCGGKMWDFMFSRRAMAAEAEKLL
jgi:high frequency lysogenization protein